MFWFVPSLAATLLDGERRKGAPLTRTEVRRLRDGAPTIIVSLRTWKELRRRRGYDDIEPGNAWTKHQALRRMTAARTARARPLTRRARSSRGATTRGKLKR